MHPLLSNLLLENGRFNFHSKAIIINQIAIKYGKEWNTVVLVKRLVAKAQTATGILLPETSVAKANQGNVIAVGPGRMDNNGKLLPMNCKVGDRVLLPEYGGTPLKMGEEEYTLFCDCDILGKFE
ncbi:Cpn10 [Blastocystis hominis]|uniref:Cpn10 n=1 Tax=Blastocystis hominis TaxID=12968 RepID=D8LXZ7_BLAHO|nr:Cpn10 [Blastocystis hominis]CBK20452.2 Cpn10 [Blastocystis hominis]|eukprot:XP_012894500.1 Cpn10 [Blastocystis hominis]